MTDYNSLKVPELKKLLSERGLTQAGNKADLISRLVENDKEQAKTEAPTDESALKKDTVEDEIDYDDDDFPPKPAAAASTTPAPATEAKPVASAAPTTTTDAAPTDAPTKVKPETDSDKKTEGAASTEPLFSQHLAPTNAKSEAEKRAARAARFGITVDKESEESRKAERASRFGVANDAVSALDSALPDRPRKRGRGGEDKEDGARDNKRQTSQPARGGRNNQNAGGRGRGRDRKGGAPREGAQNGQKAAAIDPAEKAKLEARAKRFGAAA